MEGNYCTELSFYDENEIFSGIIRKYSQEEKQNIIAIVSKFENLKYLNFRKCKIEYIPKLASENLQYLDLSCNDIEEFPNWILKQPLKFLNLGANKLRKIPDLDHLPLEFLKLHKNSIYNLPKLGDKVKSLNLYLNKFDFIPEGVFNLKLLEVFSFGVTSMKKLPDLGVLSNLRWLTLTVNQLEQLPNDICMLEKLEGLQLAKNKLKSLPEAIGNMNLTALTLYSNRIEKLPDSFFNLKLKKLNLAKNPLQSRSYIKKIFENIDFVEV